MKIELKTREIKNGSHSLYLEFTEDVKRSRQALGLYLVPERNATAKKLNKATMDKAIAIKAKRQLGIEEPIDYLTDDLLFVDWMDIYLYRLKPHVRNSTFGHHKVLVDNVNDFLRRHRATDIKVGEFNKRLYKSFLKYLKDVYRVKRGVNEYPLTPCGLYNKQRQFNQLLNAAVRAGLLKENPFKTLTSTDKFVKPKSELAFLTVDEIKRMAATDTKSRDTKQAFLFCCFTGLRLGDVMALTWDDIKKTDLGMAVSLPRMKKTDKPVVIPLNQMALEWLPNPEVKEGKVFDLPERTSCRTAVKRLAARAGITKDINFHTSRHTFATLQFTAGSDIYTTSKLLGHASVATTAIYAEVIMDKKIDAVSRIDSLFGSTSVTV